jgi:hypothetical protein
LREGSLGVSVSMSYNERFAHEKYSRVLPLAALFLKMKLQWRLRKAELKDINQSRKEKIAKLMTTSLCARRVRIR